jgi:hypothetical protein
LIELSVQCENKEKKGEVLMAPEMAFLPFDHFLLVNDQRNEKTKIFFAPKI